MPFLVGYQKTETEWLASEKKLLPLQIVNTINEIINSINN